MCSGGGEGGRDSDGGGSVDWEEGAVEKARVEPEVAEEEEEKGAQKKRGSLGAVTKGRQLKRWWEARIRTVGDSTWGVWL